MVVIDFVPLPEELVILLNQTGTNEGYYFAAGSKRMETVANNWRKRLATLWKRIGIQGGHPHRFRDTFAVELLLGGVDIKTVSMLFGHASVKVTEKHNAPWVRERQLKLEQEVRKSWEPQGIIPNSLVTSVTYDNYARATATTDGNIRKTVLTCNDAARWVVSKLGFRKASQTLHPDLHIKLSIPRDLSLVGFGDIKLDQFVLPPCLACMFAK